eukprot:2644856-Rhodomonas_salina.1
MGIDADRGMPEASNEKAIECLQVSCIKALSRLQTKHCENMGQEAHVSRTMCTRRVVSLIP